MGVQLHNKFSSGEPGGFIASCTLTNGFVMVDKSDARMRFEWSEGPTAITYYNDLGKVTRVSKHVAHGLVEEIKVMIELLSRRN